MVAPVLLAPLVTIRLVQAKEWPGQANTNIAMIMEARKDFKVIIQFC
jgi:hypothetical protein